MHGFDSQKREADLRLDQADAATAVLPSGNRALVPGALDESTLYQRIVSTDPDSVMLTVAHRQLNDAEKETIRKWIEQGASYQGHWSFEPIASPAVPNRELIGAELWQESPIDRFLWLKMRSKGLAPKPKRTKRRCSTSLFRVDWSSSHFARDDRFRVRHRRWVPMNAWSIGTSTPAPSARKWPNTGWMWLAMAIPRLAS